MKLYELVDVVVSNFMVGVNKGKKFIDEFGINDTQKCTKYREALVTSVHVLNEETIAINVDIAE